MKSFLTTCQLERREIKDTPNYKILLAWARKKGITLEKAILTDKAKYDLLQLLWVYQDVGATQLKGILLTNFITHRIKPREGTKVHNAKHKKL